MLLKVKRKKPREVATSTGAKANQHKYILTEKGGKVNDGTNSPAR